MIKLIIFDFDDTLVDSKKAHYNIDAETAKVLNLKPVSENEYFKYYGMPYEKMVRVLYPDAPINKYLDISKEMYHSTDFQPFPHTIDTLNSLKDKYKLAIISSKQKLKLIKALKDTNLIEYFEYIQAQEDSIYHKPDPRVFNDILEHFNLNCYEVVYVGDLEIDEIAATKAGIKFFGINSKENKQNWHQSISELKKLI